MEECVRIRLPITKTNSPRVFVIIEGGFDDLNLVQIFKKYWNLRPENCSHSRFFINFHNGRCTRNPIGVNTLRTFPQKIATFLNLPDPKAYTGHSFRRTSASLLAELGMETTILKRHGGWRSDKTAEAYVEQSIHSEKSITGRILGYKPSETNYVINEPQTSHDAPVFSCLDAIPSTSNCENLQSEFSFQVPNLGNDSNILPIPSLPPSSTINFPFNISTTSTTENVAPNTIQFNMLSNCTINIYQK